MNKLEQESKNERGHASISPTAVAVAYSRTFSDIPLSTEIFEEMQVINAQTGINFSIEQIKGIVPPETAPMFEARFKLTDKILEESQVKQVLEIASGFSQRGLIMSQDPLIKYSELDLPGIMAEKKTVAEHLVENGKISRAANLYFHEGNALDMDDILSATQEFEEKPIAVLNEGLLRYLNREQRSIVAKNVHRLLEKFGGAWITPDTCVKLGEQSEGRSMQGSDEKIQQLTGIDVQKYYFKNEDEAQEFFENLGFTVERRNFMDVYGKLVSPENLNLPPEKIKDILKQRSVFVIRVGKE